MIKDKILTLSLLTLTILNACGSNDPVITDDDKEQEKPVEPEKPDTPPSKYATSSMWTEFISCQTSGNEATLSDYSYAGYKHGELDVPDVAYKVFRVDDFGAVPNDGKSDRKALTDAIEAAKANGEGVILFSAGRYDLRTEDAPNEPVIIDADKIVLRGAGCESGGTELFMEHPNQVLDASLWNTPELISFRYVRSTDKKLADVTGNATKGSFSVEIDNTASLTAGDRVFIRLSNNDPRLITQELGGYDANANWTELMTQGVQVTEYHEVAKVSGNKVTFKEPIMHAIDNQWGWTLHEHSCHKGNGVEDIAFVGNFKEPFSHHLNALHDSGFRMLTLSRQVDGWVRRCRFTDVSEALSVVLSGNVSVYSCSITGNPGHSAIRAQASTGVFIGKVNDQAGQFHSVGVSKTSIGTVLWRNTWTTATCFEAHASQPRCTLFDTCEGGFMAARSGGDEAAAPNHLGELILWNFNETDGGEKDFDTWRRNTRWVRPIIVGMHGGSTSFKTTQVTAEEGNGTLMEPLSLYEAQITRRLGAIPQWLNNLK